MSLKTKFSLLLGVTGLAVAIMLGVSLWSFSVLEREVRGTLRSNESVLGGLNSLKRSFWDQAELLGRSSFPGRRSSGGAEPDLPPRDESVRARFLRLDRRIDAELSALEQMDSFYTRSGITRARDLRQGAREVRDEALAWFDDADEEALAAAADILYRQHERIEATEAAILSDAELGVEYASRVKGLVMTGLAGAVVLVVLAAALAVLLVRRWILRPVGALREAAARIGAGDYEHRIGMAGDDEIARLASEVDEMAGLVKAMQDERIERERLAAAGEMVQRIVHNIRGPLGGIRNLAEIVERGAGRESLVRDSVGRIKATVDRFDQWITDMLHATSPADVAPRPIDVAPWLAGIVEGHRSAAESAGVTLDAELDGIPAVASLDPHHMEQALVALITNAIEASPRGGRVLVRGEAAERNGTWRILVQDEGAGIRAELLGRIFRPYVTTKKGGSGIGLAHARQIVERHAGRIWAENIEDGASGARFIVELRAPARSTGDE